ncbi:hypothetical protein IRZ59_25345, partial [Pseudomonas guariconensis]|nr:hypothetical protein [Pseudomonas guariconensis]
MPTENRSSNTEMVSVPREWAQHYADLLEERCGYEKAEQVTAFLAQPAEQHQGEPGAYQALADACAEQAVRQGFKNYAGATYTVMRDSGEQFEVVVTV